MWLSTYLLAAYGIPGTPLLSSMDLLFDDTHRAAIEVIVEERTGYRDPEDRDGDHDSRLAIHDWRPLTRM